MLGVFIENGKRTKTMNNKWYPTVGFGLKGVYIYGGNRILENQVNRMRDRKGHPKSNECFVSVLIGKLVA